MAFFLGKGMGKGERGGKAGERERGRGREAERERQRERPTTRGRQSRDKPGSLQPGLENLTLSRPQPAWLSCIQ